MAPVQQTFSVIPELPSAFANGSDTANARPSKPPMTTKQAKKLYKAATKAPKLSKAEQRRQDLMEQDRIRREFEKERNQARAKTARDKKKEKEEKEKAEKKKKGLPLKEVHPSQDTLARFMRPLKPPKKVEEKPRPPPSPSPPSPPQTAPDDESDGTSPVDADDDHRPVKRQRLEEPVEQATDATPCDQLVSGSPELRAQDEIAPELPAVEAEKVSQVVVSSDRNVDDSRTEDQNSKRRADEPFSVDDGLDDDDFSALFQNHQAPPIAPDPLSRMKEHTDPPADASETDVTCNAKDSDSPPLDDAPLRKTQETDRNTRNGHPTINPAETANAPFVLNKIPSTTYNSPGAHMTSRQPLCADMEAVELERVTIVRPESKRPMPAGIYSSETPAPRREPQPLPQPTKQPMSTSLKAKPANPTITPKMAPPPLPPRFKSPGFKSSEVAGDHSRFPPKAAPTPPTVMSNSHARVRDEPADDYTLPTSTQLFLLNNLDDLFPSPSQEVQEIFERPREIRKRTFTRQQPLPPPRPKPSITATKMRNSPVTPYSTTARQPMRHTLPGSRMMSSVPPPKPKHNDASLMPPKSHGQCKMSDGDFPFLSTQDIFMSSQDIRELEDGTSSPIKPSKPPESIVCNQATKEVVPPKLEGPRSAIDTPNGQTMGWAVAPNAKTPKLNTPVVAEAHGQLPHLTEDPTIFSSQCSSIPDTPSLRRRNTRAPQSRFMHPRGAPRSSAKRVAPDEQQSSSSNPFRFKPPNHATPRPSPTFQTAKPVPVVEPTGAADSQCREAPRPSPKPFFTSSGTRELTYLAIERSKRSAREDIHARRKATEELAKREMSKRLKETPKIGPIPPAKENRPPSGHDDDDNDYELDEILLASDLAKDSAPSIPTEPQKANAASRVALQTSFQCPKKPAGAMPAQNRPRSPDEKKSESGAPGKPKSSYEKMLELAAKQRECHDQGGKHIGAFLDENEKENREPDIPTASQGTDYGDVTWDMTDFDLDGFL
ncbi:hypothetical protein PG989_004035 [Apiospora arundinis]